MPAFTLKPPHLRWNKQCSWLAICYTFPVYITALPYAVFSIFTICCIIFFFHILMWKLEFAAEIQLLFLCGSFVFAQRYHQTDFLSEGVTGEDNHVLGSSSRKQTLSTVYRFFLSQLKGKVFQGQPTHLFKFLFFFNTICTNVLRVLNVSEWHNWKSKACNCIFLENA